MSTRTKRLSLSMGKNFAALLADEANHLGGTEADVIRRAVATYAYLRRECAVDGRVTVVGADGRLVGLVLG